ncbi:ATP-dependent DNA helicase [Aphis craccivora]|uniref:ATP-dependent DNA helicase n=1 Tax=Aphis craccivora TaxID=307492 RepID=A0A6G0Z221_APHCR|nr:ATP-dependent DNA helicase [Aphis craccivora]
MTKKIDWHRSKCLQFSGATHFCDDHQQSIQGQLLLQVFAMNSESPCISHGQLYYVACLRVGKPSDLFAYAPEGRTKNITAGGCGDDVSGPADEVGSGGGGGGGVIERYIAAPNEVLFGRNRYHGYDCGRLSAAAVAAASPPSAPPRGRHPNHRRRRNYCTALVPSTVLPVLFATHAEHERLARTHTPERITRGLQVAAVVRCAANHCTQPRFLLLPPRCTAHAVRPAAAESDRLTLPPVAFRPDVS